ncbi:MAG: family 1 glycosylhydrolase [Patescibacteria group bacterium]
MKLNIPSDFILGIADSDLQVIGEKWTRAEEHSEQTMWDTFCHSGKCFANTSTEIGVDRYHRFPEDIELMKKLGVRHYRTSISMSRTLHPDGRPHEGALRWYANYFKLLKAAGIKIYATLYHWELPQYLSEQGGWTNRRTIDYFLKHTALVAERLGEYIEEYFVLNEPWCSAFLGHFVGIHAPGEKNLKSALLATHNLLLAQGLAVRILSHISPRPKIGTVTMVEPAYPATDSPKDREAARYADEHQNWWFLDPLFLGQYQNFCLITMVRRCRG